MATGGKENKPRTIVFLSASTVGYLQILQIFGHFGQVLSKSYWEQKALRRVNAG
jgi:hypothetical protein